MRSTFVACGLILALASEAATQAVSQSLTPRDIQSCEVVQIGSGKNLLQTREELKGKVNLTDDGPSEQSGPSALPRRPFTQVSVPSLLDEEIRPWKHQAAFSYVGTELALLLLCLLAAALIMANGSNEQQAKDAARSVQGGAADKGCVSKFREDIQGLRALAVMSVYIYHLKSEWLPGGFTGVDIFFVISGFVVTPQLARQADRPKDSIITFFARRVKRLVPVLVVVVLSTATFLVIAYPKSGDPTIASKFIHDGIAGLWGNANNWMLSESLDYCDQQLSEVADYNPFLHLWSLGVEEQFYIFLPAIVLYSGQARVPILIAALALSMAACWYFCTHAESAASGSAFYLLPSRFWELGIGATLALCSEHIQKALESSTVARILDMLAVLFLAISLCFTPVDGRTFPWPWAVVPVVGASCYLVAGLGTTRANLNTCLSSLWIAHLGNLSYSFYLWHVPVLALMAWMNLSGTALTLSLPLTFLLSSASFKFIEQPCRRSGSMSDKSVLLLAAASLIASSCLLLLVDQARLEWSSVDIGVPADLPGLFAPQCKCRAGRLLQEPPGAEALPQCLYETNEIAGPSLGFALQYAGLCAATEVGVTPRLIAECLPNSPERAGPSIYLIGDSHAWALLPALQAATAYPVFGIAALGWNHLSKLQEHLAQLLKPDDIVVYILFEGPYMVDVYRSEVPVLASLTNRTGAKLLLVANSVLLHGHPATCVLEGKHPTSCATTLQENRGRCLNMSAVRDRVKQSHKNVYIFDVLPLLCDGEMCDMYVPGTSTPAYRDQHHWSINAALYLSPHLCSLMQSMQDKSSNSNFTF